MEKPEHIGSYSYVHGPSGQRITTDTLLLSEFALPLKDGDSVMDLGTGAGVLPLIFAARSGCRSIAGVEIDEGAAKAALQNIEANGLSGRIKISNMDLRKLPEVYPEGAFSVVVSNPPYVKAGAGRVSPVKERGVARSESCPLAELITVSKHLIGISGRACFVFPCQRLQEMLITIGSKGLQPRRLRFVHTKDGRPAKLFLIEAAATGGNAPVVGCAVEVAEAL